MERITDARKDHQPLPQEARRSPAADERRDRCSRETPRVAATPDTVGRRGSGSARHRLGYGCRNILLTAADRIGSVRRSERASSNTTVALSITNAATELRRRRPSSGSITTSTRRGSAYGRRDASLPRRKTPMIGAPAELSTSERPGGVAQPSATRSEGTVSSECHVAQMMSVLLAKSRRRSARHTSQQAPMSMAISPPDLIVVPPQSLTRSNGRSLDATDLDKVITSEKVLQPASWTQVGPSDRGRCGT